MSFPRRSVIPAEAGIQTVIPRKQDVIPTELVPAEAGSENPEKETKIFANRLDSCFRRNDEKIAPIPMIHHYSQMGYIEIYRGYFSS